MQAQERTDQIAKETSCSSSGDVEEQAGGMVLGRRSSSMSFWCSRQSWASKTLSNHGMLKRRGFPIVDFAMAMDATVHKIAPLSASGLLAKNERIKNDRLQHLAAVFLWNEICVWGKWRKVVRPWSRVRRRLAGKEVTVKIDVWRLHRNRSWKFLGACCRWWMKRKGKCFLWSKPWRRWSDDSKSKRVDLLLGCDKIPKDIVCCVQVQIIQFSAMYSWIASLVPVDNYKTFQQVCFWCTHFPNQPGREANAQWRPGG